MIYFVQPVTGGPVKIGRSVNVDIRIRQLESHYGQPLSLLAVMDGEEEREREIHERFSHLRYGRTEQFRPASDLMAFIGRPLLVDPNPDAVEAIEPTPGRAVIMVPCRQAFKDWVVMAAEEQRLTVPQMIDFGLVALAKVRGFRPPPPRL